MAYPDVVEDHLEAPIPDFSTYPVLHRPVGAGLWDGGIAVGWSDGHESRFHALWLRDNCPCEACVNYATREQVFDISTVAPTLAVAGIGIGPGGAIEVTWSDGHESSFHPGWLRAHCYSDKARDTRRRGFTSWDGTLDVPRFDGRAILEDDRTLLAWLETLRDVGLALVHDCPLDEGAVEWFADRISFLRQTNFGRVFDVRSKADPDSNAYTALELPLHVDLPTRELQPGLQFLLCRVNDAVGGDSIMADGFRIAEAMREEAPDHFEALTTIPMEFRNRARRSDYRARVPAIRLAEDGSIDEIRLGNFLRGPMEAAEQDMPRLYAAYRHFIAMTRESRFRVLFRLGAGDMSTFDNRRVLHARSAFDPTSGDRHLQGCYVDTDELLSRIRVLRRSFGVRAAHGFENE